MSGAAAPSAGADAAAPYANDELDWARLLVRRLPWSERGAKPTSPEARRLAALFRRAVAVDGWSRDDVQAFGLDRLAAARPAGQGNPMAWVTNAVDPAKCRLPRPGFAARLVSEPLEDSLGFPEQEAPEKPRQGATRPAGEPPTLDHSKKEGHGRENRSEGATEADSGEGRSVTFAAARDLLAELGDAAEVDFGRLSAIATVSAAIEVHGLDLVADQLRAEVPGSSRPHKALLRAINALTVA